MPIIDQSNLNNCWLSCPNDLLIQCCLISSKAQEELHFGWLLSKDRRQICIVTLCCFETHQAVISKASLAIP